MNDRAEILWYLIQLNKNTDILECMKERACLDFSCNDFLNILENQGQQSAYTASFSKDKDSLSQWRSYANDGKGIAIGFDLNELSRAKDNVLIREIEYTDKIIYPSNSECDMEVVADEVSVVLKYDEVKKCDQLNLFLHELIPELLKYKNPSFKEEQEIRLIYCKDLKFENLLYQHHAIRGSYNSINLDVNFRTINDNDITAYVKLPFNPKAIHSISIGPKCLVKQCDIKNFINETLSIDLEYKNIITSKSGYR